MTFFVSFFRCNPGGSKRTWEQTKIKYKNILQSGKCPSFEILKIHVLYCFNSSVFHNCIGKRSHFFPILAANKKKKDQRKTGGGPPPAEFTPAEELALSNNEGRPLMVGVEGGFSTDPGCSSSHYLYIQGKIQGA